MAVKRNNFILPDFVKTSYKYYLYMHIRLDTKEIFYIGVGTKHRENDYSRAKDFKKRNLFWKRVVNKTDYDILIFNEYSTKKECLEKEINYISLLGKRKDKKGQLVNLTNGGEGGGVIGKKHTEETKRKIAKANSKRVWREDSKEKLGKSVSLRNKTKTGAESYRGKKVSIVQNDNSLLTFDTLKEVAFYIGISAQSVGQALKNNHLCKGLKIIYG